MRTKPKATTGGAIVVLLTCACSGASLTQSIQPQVEITLETAPEGSRDDTPTIVTASADNTVLSGVISTPNPCYTIEGDIAADGRDLTLTVTARSKPGICVQMLGSFAYQARVTGLASGNYPTRVVYQYPNTGWEAKEYDLLLTIP